MTRNTTAIDALRPLFAAPNATAVLCGAGISYASGVPLAGAVKELTLRALLGTEPCTYPVGELLQRIGFLPFEAFVEIVLRNLSSFARRSISIPRDANDLGNVACAVLNDIHDRFFDVFRSTTPGRTHRLLAHLMESRMLRWCMTTNFDTLIEQAFEPRSGTRLTVLCDELDFASPRPLAADEALLAKIHGSVDLPSTVRTTLDGVADPARKAGRRALIHELFGSGEHGSVLIVGYSCSDVFDISPEIETVSGGLKRVLLVRHDSRVPLSQAEVVPIGSISPFARYDGLAMTCNTDEVVNHIAEWSRVSLPPPPPRPQTSLDFLVDLAHAPPVDRYFALGQVFYHASAMAEAVFFGQKAAAVAEAGGFAEAISRAYSNLAAAQLQNGDAEGAARSMEKAERAGSSEVSSNRITMLLSEGRFAEARRKYKKSAKAAKDPLLHAGALTGGSNVANGMGRFVEGLELANEALTCLGLLPMTTQVMTLRVHCGLYLAHAHAGLGRADAMDILMAAEKEASCLHSALLLDRVMLMRWKLSMLLRRLDLMDAAHDSIVRQCSTEVLRDATVDILRVLRAPEFPGSGATRAEVIELFTGLHHFLLDRLSPPG